MENLIVIYGGKSVEHDISVLTALQTIKNINKQKYVVYPIYQTRNCEFVIVKDYLNPKAYIDKIKSYKKVEFLFNKGAIKIGNKIKKTIKIDCAINCCHGNSGEDGTIAVLMNLTNIPLTSCNNLASAICMDKIIMKDIFVANNIPCVKYSYITQTEFKNEKKKCLDNLKEKLEFPMIVKPSNLGSSIGIKKANNIEELENAINVALCYDKRVIVEECLLNFKEINIACVGNYDCELSNLEQPTNWKEFLDFDDKYQNIKKDSKIMSPKLKAGVKEQIETLAKKCFKIFDLSGVVRIDFMVKDTKVYVNEINSVPGSLAYYLFKPKTEFFELIDKMIELAKEKHTENLMHNYTYNSNVLLNYKENSINKYSK